MSENWWFCIDLDIDLKQRSGWPHKLQLCVWATISVPLRHGPSFQRHNYLFTPMTSGLGEVHQRMTGRYRLGSAVSLLALDRGSANKVARAEVEAHLEKMPISARKRLSQPFRKFVACGGKQLKSGTPQRRLDS